MATLSKHGQSIIVEGVSKKKAYCSDGNILINRGFGWKTWRKLKAGIDYREAAQQSKERIKQELDEKPELAYFFNLIKSLCPSLEKRQFVIMALEVSYHDPDGMWSDLDDNWHTRNYLSFDDCNKLCTAYKALI